MRVLPPRTARLLYRSRRAPHGAHGARLLVCLPLHAEDVRYVLVSELSKKKAAAGRLLCHGFTSRALGLSMLARVKAVVPSQRPFLRLFARTAAVAAAAVQAGA